ncbi:MAG: hypothetical protein ACRDDW_04280 [Candidatus Rhabdochlamydia sp.]
MSDDFNELVLEAHKRSFQRAFEMAVRTQTSLIFSENGKIVEVKPSNINLYESKKLKKNKRRKK